jgi:predicted AAA+ superfamily ATPase
MDAAPLPRGLAPALRAALADTPVVCLLGPRQCGKTTLARSPSPGYGYVTFDDEDALTLARSDPNGFLAALPDPVILDEIQRAPDLLRALKLSVDRDRRPGRFLLTGSANLLLLPKLGESLAGRMAIIELQPFTVSERERSPGSFLSTWHCRPHQAGTRCVTGANSRPAARRTCDCRWISRAANPESGPCARMAP